MASLYEQNFLKCSSFTLQMMEMIAAAVGSGEDSLGEGLPLFKEDGELILLCLLICSVLALSALLVMLFYPLS